MNNITQNQLRILGLLGMLGGLTLFAGDMLFYYHPTQTRFLQTMSQASDTRIIASGITALVASWLYMAGLGQVYYAFKPAGHRVQWVVTASMGAILMSYGVVHGAYVGIATSAKLAMAHQLNLNEATALAVRTNNALRFMVYPVFALLSVVFLYAVWKKQTYYPRWMVVAFPLLPFLFKNFIVAQLLGLAYVVVAGGYLNLLLVLFFAASTLALWKPKIPATR